MQGQTQEDWAATLVAAARSVASAAYAPYSRFRVGAAILGRSGRIHVGCNVENASYGLSVCAERAALARAVAEGERDFVAVAVVSEPDGTDPPAECLPCGACRQVLAELGADDLRILTVDASGAIHQRRLGALLPEAFRLAPPGEPPSPTRSAAPPAPAAARPTEAQTPERRVRQWLAGTGAAVGDALATLVALAAGDAQGAARQTWLPACAGVVAAAVAGALAGAAVPAPADAPLASTAAAATLAAPAVIGLAAAILWARAGQAARISAEAWHSLRVRGAALWQLWGLLALTGLPRLAVIAVSGAGATVLATVAVAMASFFARAATTTSGAIFAGALGWSAWAAVALVVAALAGTIGSGLRPPTHFRAVGTGGRGWNRYLPDVLLLLIGVALASGAWLYAKGGPAPVGAAFGGPIPTAVEGTAPFWLRPAVYAGGGAFLLGGALLGGRILAAVLGVAESLRAARLGAVWTVVLRAASRGTTPLRMCLLPALGAAALAFVLAGPLGVARSNRDATAVLAGADVRLPQTWLAHCPHAAGSDAAQLTPGGCPIGAQMPLPDVTTYNAVVPGAAGTATLVEADDRVSGPSGSLAVQLVGLDPQPFAAIASWQGAPGGPAALRALAATPQGAVISQGLARATGLHVGDRLATGMVSDLRVVAIVPAWPGVGLGGASWAVMQSNVLIPAIDREDLFAQRGVSAQLLMRLQPGADLQQVASAIGQVGGQTGSPIWPHSSAAGLAWLPEALGPIAAGALLLLWPALALVDLDPAAFPRGDALSALAAEPEARKARRLLHAITGWFGLAWGLAAGTAAAALFWPAVRLQTAGLSAVPYEPNWWGAWIAAAVAALGLIALATPLGRPTPDPVVVARVEEAALQRPEPPPAEPRTVLREPVAARRHATRGSAGLLHNPAFAFAVLAVRRLRTSWGRLLGLGVGILLASAIAATVPLYTAGSLTRVLQSGLQPENERPPGAMIVSLFPTAGAPVTQADLDRLASLTGGAGGEVGLPATPPVSYLVSTPLQYVAENQVGNADAQSGYLALDAISALSGHVTLERGTVPAAAPEADGTLDAAATDQTMIQAGLQFGQVYVLTLPDLSHLRVRIVGVFAEKDPSGTYWPYKYFSRDLFVDPGLLTHAMIQTQTVPMDEAAWYTVLDMRGLTAESVPAALNRMAGFGVHVADGAPGARVDVSPFHDLSGFVARQVTLTTLLRLVAIPILALTLYFVALTAGLIVDAEAGEIAVYTSRGANTGHILLLYLLEWVLLAIPLAAVAPFPAILFARAMGAIDGFLHFTARPPLAVFLRPVDFAYAAVAAALAVVAALMPTITAMSRSIVAARLRASRTVDQPLWQRAYLDAVALLVLIAAWWVFRRVTLGTGGAAAIASDPALYLLPAIFLAVSGLLAIRFLGWLLRNLDAGLGPWLQPAAVFPLRRIGRLPAHFAPVLLLLCFTGALGTYSAAAARTLNSNLVSNVRYQDGAPVRLEQLSPCTDMQKLVGVCIQYDNVLPDLPSGASRPLPAFALNLKPKGVADASPIETFGATLMGGQLGVANATLVLIDPASLARVGWWDTSWNPQAESRYLEALQSNPNAVYVSPTLSRSVHDGTVGLGVSGGTVAQVPVAGTVDRWPGADVTGPIVVGTIDGLSRELNLTCGANPCAVSRVVLMDLKPGADVNSVIQDLGNYGLATTRLDVATTEEAQAVATPEWAGQSGLLSIGFLVALAVAAVGYLLYASLLLRGQVSQLGLLRALGLDWAQVVGAVALEQGILVVAGALAGVIAGVVAARLFLPLFRPAFTGPNAPPFAAIGPGNALWQVAALLILLFGLVLLSLLALLKRMHVGETVKLEEG